jgi:hypothetical protein
MHRWFIPGTKSIVDLDSKSITFGEVFSIFFMQRWELLFVADSSQKGFAFGNVFFTFNAFGGKSVDDP